MIWYHAAGSLIFGFAGYLVFGALASSESWRERARHLVGIAGVSCLGASLFVEPVIHPQLLLVGLGLMFLDTALDTRQFFRDMRARRRARRQRSPNALESPAGQVEHHAPDQNSLDE